MTVVPVVATVIFILVIWPSGATGQRLLVKWGIPEPTREQTQAATRYLRRRRILYPVFWILAPAWLVLVAALRGWQIAGSRYLGLLAGILAAMLLAELVAALRPPRATTRSAVLSRRRWRDLAPWWAVTAHLILVGLAVGQAAASLAAHGWAADAIAHARLVDDLDAGPGGIGGPGDLPVLTVGVRTAHEALDLSGTWLALAGAALGLIAVYGVVLLAVLRPAAADPEVDAVLRTRSARVAIGIGIGLALGLVNQTNAHVATLHSIAVGGPTVVSPPPGWLELAAGLDGAGVLIALILGLAVWRMVTSPPPRPVTAVPAPA
jgi:hypothetical protein